MSNNDIKKLIEDEYRIDVDSIRNLSKLANELTINNKLIIPGGLEIQGPLTVSKDVNISGNTTVGKDVNISGNTTISKKITTKGGGDFSGGRYHFNDAENCGKLRVGCVWGKPGIYAEDGKHLALGSGSGEVQFQNNSSRIKSGTGTFGTVNTSTVNTNTVNGSTGKFSTVDTSTVDASKVNIEGSSVELLTLNKTGSQQHNLIDFRYNGQRKQRFGVDGNSNPWYGFPGGVSRGWV